MPPDARVPVFHYGFCVVSQSEDWNESPGGSVAMIAFHDLARAFLADTFRYALMLPRNTAATAGGQTAIRTVHPAPPRDGLDGTAWRKRRTK